jgi:DNA-binding CsgD family transcriptional regulator
VSAPQPESTASPRRRHGSSLTAREREILGLLATGLSGAEIAAQLVLSPETVRTHVRNAMAKLGASTRSQAVAIALRRSEIAEPGEDEVAVAVPRREVRRRLGSSTAAFAPVHDHLESAANFDGIVDGLVAMHEIDAATVYLAEEDGMTLRRRAARGEPGAPLTAAAEVIALGEGPIGRVALERRAQLVLLDRGGGEGARGAVIAPMVAGRLVGVLCFAVRASRPAGRGELLLSQAFATRLAELLTEGRDGDIEGRLASALERFRTSWTATTGA